MSSPGWYPDPSGKGQRYFDGTTWGPSAPSEPTPAARFTVHYGFALLAIISLVMTVAIGVPLSSSATDPQAGAVGGGMAILWWLWGGMWTLVWAAFAVQHTLRGRRD